jgi:zinc/manganese transport system substrate-binding protein
MTVRLLSLALLTILIPPKASVQEREPERVAVIATFSILGDMVERVGGEHVEVRTLVGPEADAHVYQPTPADAAEVAKARIVFENGLGFEGWLTRLIRSSGYRGEVVTVTNGVNAIVAKDDHTHAGGVRGAPDPHAWQDVANALAYVANIRDGLCRVDQARCSHYAFNAGAYQAEIVLLHAEIKSSIRAVAPDRRKVITSHDAFGYFGHAYGITFMAPQGLSTESEPSARDVARLIDQIRRQKVKAVFVESISNPRLIEQIARETGVKVGGTLYSDALSKPGGPAATYLDMMRHNARVITDALGCC